MRLFYAVILPDSIKRSLDGAAKSAAAAIRTSGGKAKPVEAANMHVTLRFLGDTPDESVPGLTGKVLADAVATAVRKWGGSDTALSISGVGGFPDLRRARVLWAGVGGATDLLGFLHRELDSLAVSKGLEPERGRYSPHVTLCRVPEGLPRDSVCLGPWVERYREERFGDLTGWDVCLYKSDLSGMGPTYTVLDRTPITLG